MTPRNIPDAIHWEEGQLLAPQHFQQNALRHERLLRYSTQSATPFLWGIRQFEYDANQLLQGRLRVLKLEATLPDGLPVWHEPGDGRELEIDLNSRAALLQSRPCTVYLTVPEETATVLQGDTARYEVIAGEVVQDIGGISEPVYIPRLRPRLSLIVSESAPPPRFISLPLIELEWGEAGLQTTGYIPPVTQVLVNSPLGSLCVELARHLREKAYFAAEQARARATAGKTAQSLESRWMVQCLISALPALEALLYSNAAHPFQLYTGVAFIAGSVAGLSAIAVPPTFPHYDHRNPRVAFHYIRDWILQIVEEGISEKWRSFRFVYHDGAFRLESDPDWTGQLDPAKAGQSFVLGMRPSTGMTAKDLMHWASEAVIAGESVMSSLVARRVLGLRRQFEESVEGLVAPRGSYLFTVFVDQENLKIDEELQITSRKSTGPQPAEIFLYIQNSDK